MNIYKSKQIWSVDQKPGLIGAQADFLQVHDHGAMVVDSMGKIVEIGPASPLEKKFENASITDFGDSIILPGFIDTHIHFPQMDMIGCYGEKLLNWLETYTYPEEAKFSSRSYAAPKSKLFFDTLFANGTTCAAIYSSSSAVATECLFETAKNRGARALIGKVSMDVNVPKQLSTDPDQEVSEHQSFIANYHGFEKRLYYALTPRFAPACTPKTLRQLGDFCAKDPSLFVQTHYAETRSEIDWVKDLFPKSKNYLGVYEDFGLLGEKTILGHGIHPTSEEMTMLKRAQVKIAHCPTSNLFLGSGLFPKKEYFDLGIEVGLATDVGAGTSFSLWRTMAEAYKIQQLQDIAISPVMLLYMATLGGAIALGQSDVTGSLEAEKSADFQVIDWQREPLLHDRFASQNPIEQLFAMINLCNRDLIHSTWVAGKQVHRNA